MPKTRDNYSVTGNTVQELINSLNFLLARLADRMDKIEGIRGAPSIEADLTMNSSLITDVGGGAIDSDAARLADLGDFPKRQDNETISGSWTFADAATFESDVSVEGNVYVYDSGGNLIHSLE